MTRHYAKSNVNILFTRNLPFDPDVRQWRYLFMVPLYCLWVKLNNRTRVQFECDVNWFCFYFEFVRSHAQCGSCSIVFWRGWRGGVRLKLDVQSQQGGIIWYVDGHGGGGGGGVLKIRQFSWTSYVYCPWIKKYLMIWWSCSRLKGCFFFLKLYNSYMSLEIVRDSSDTEESIIFIYLVF